MVHPDWVDRREIRFDVKVALLRTVLVGSDIISEHPCSTAVLVRWE